jgi:hypothetical protein
MQGPADIEQADRADAIDAALVILDLLKRDTQGPGQLFLTEVQRKPPLAYSNANISVDFQF